MYNKNISFFNYKQGRYAYTLWRSVASNALSIVQAYYEKTLRTKDIENNGEIIEFTMYVYWKKTKFLWALQNYDWQEISRKWLGNKSHKNDIRRD